MGHSHVQRAGTGCTEEFAVLPDHEMPQQEDSTSTDEISQSFLVDEFSILERIEDINEEVMQLLETHKSC